MFALRRLVFSEHSKPLGRLEAFDFCPWHSHLTGFVGGKVNVGAIGFDEISRDPVAIQKNEDIRLGLGRRLGR
ncbi:MAG: hypothetical protein ACYDC6_04415 [Acidobacteriaceae bacterium]